ncbi:S-type anion channel SLAH1-like isoform X2 [Diospyros lotus]|uniref:S-type anion channel SLAH1-like isoform X2 n=1 Tax=Diospyros lotus TaxID=55363 RepID=UPI002259D809|nr:S-type anion channel SLAH1-like isoform X2 [Diospyros lotus]
MAKDPSNHHTQIELVVIEPSPISTQPSHAGVSKSTILPILARFHAGYFRISLSLCSQALLWKTLGEPMPEAHSLRPLLRRLPAKAFVLLWVVALLTLISLSLLYTLKCLLQFNKVKDEFSNRIGVNYLFAPWISWLLLLQSSPFFNPNTALYVVLWWVFIVPILVMDVKIYGQWFTKGKRFLSGVANPTSQLSVIGNLVAALAAARMGWKEAAVGLFALGMAHYLVLFVTLYQRLAGSDCLLPAILRPVLFLFFAAPSVASLAWDSIAGSFDNPSKMLFFLSLFLFLSLVSTKLIQNVYKSLTCLLFFQKKKKRESPKSRNY